MAGYNLVPTREQIKVGSRVKLVQKKDYESGVVTDGVVSQILTSKPNHPRGIKVRLTNGVVGRVQALGGEPVRPLDQKTESTRPPVDYQPDEDELL